MLSIFSSVFFGKASIHVFCPFSDWIVCGCFFFYIEWCELFIYFGYQSLVDLIICKYFLPFRRLSFHFVGGFLCCARDFKFKRSYLFTFFFSAFMALLDSLASFLTISSLNRSCPPAPFFLDPIDA